MIIIDGALHAYGDATVLDDVDLTLPRGCLTSFVGPNGAGTSTLLSVVTRLLTPRSGQVLVDGVDVATAAPEVIARRLAVLRQDNHVTARLTVLDLVRFGRFPHCRGRLRPQDHEVVEEALGQLTLGGFRDRYLDSSRAGNGSERSWRWFSPRAPTTRCSMSSSTTSYGACCRDDGNAAASL